MRSRVCWTGTWRPMTSSTLELGTPLISSTTSLIAMFLTAWPFTEIMTSPARICFPTTTSSRKRQHQSGVIVTLCNRGHPHNTDAVSIKAAGMDPILGCWPQQESAARASRSTRYTTPGLLLNVNYSIVENNQKAGKNWAAVTGDRMQEEHALSSWKQGAAIAITRAGRHIPDQKPLLCPGEPSTG